jgi:hypothetical protein
MSVEDVMHPDERSYALLEPQVQAALARLLEVEGRFSTKRVLDALRSDPEGQAAYEAAVSAYRETGSDEHMARLIVHGQVVPEILRHSGQVRFGGFIHGRPDEDDGFGVPSWWRRV